MPVGADEAFERDSQGVIYEVNGEGTAYTVTGSYDTADDVVIPATFNSLPVTSISYMAFAYCTTIEPLTIGANVDTIDPYAFVDCTRLTQITIPENVVYVSDNLNGITTL